MSAIRDEVARRILRLPRQQQAMAVEALARITGGPLLTGSNVKASADWRGWLQERFPAAVTAPFAPRHVRLWEWFAALVPGVKPPPEVEIWPRGGAKSSTAELGVTWVGLRGTRKFALYVSGTQGQANKHVQAIATRFEKLGRGRALNRYGNSLGWRVDLLRVDNGFNVLALGLDAAARGIKLEDARPDLIILDDVDERHESEESVKKKVATITESILPTGATDAAVLFVQNRIHSGSIATMLATGTADFLHGRRLYEEPAVKSLEYQADQLEDGRRWYRITGGEATWEGQNLKTCELQMNEWGRSAFLREAQHETEESEDGLWDRERDLDPFRISQNKLPAVTRIVVAVDPNATSGGDEAGIVAAGIWRTPQGVLHGYVIEDATVGGGPATWAKASVACYKRWEADALVAEANNGGDMVAITIGTVPGSPPVKLIHASRGKLTRAEPVQKLYEDGRVHHVGVFIELERELCRWRPDGSQPSPNRLDACVWALTELMLSGSFDPSDFDPVRSR